MLRNFLLEAGAISEWLSARLRIMWLSVRIPLLSPRNYFPLHLKSYYCLFNSLSGKYQQNFDLNFKRALRDITTKEGFYVFEKFCQNDEVVS